MSEQHPPADKTGTVIIEEAFRIPPNGRGESLLVTADLTPQTRNAITNNPHLILTTDISPNQEKCTPVGRIDILSSHDPGDNTLHIRFDNAATEQQSYECIIADNPLYIRVQQELDKRTACDNSAYDCTMYRM